MHFTSDEGSTGAKLIDICNLNYMYNNLLLFYPDISLIEAEPANYHIYQIEKKS